MLKVSFAAPAQRTQTFYTIAELVVPRRRLRQGVRPGLDCVDERLRLMLSPRLRSHLPNDALERVLFAKEGQQMRLPERFKPCAEFLDYHRASIFGKA